MKSNSLARSTILVLTLLLATAMVYAQNPNTKSSGSAQNPASTAKAGKREPCWQVAGISQSAMQQHKELQESAHSQIQSVCEDSSLTQQQKRAKIREIHEQTRQKGEALITPQQQQALKSCRQERGEGKHMAGQKGMHHGGPCGDMAMQGGEKSPDSNPKP